MTIEELHKIRGEMKKALCARDPSGKTCQVIVGMGESGIAAGAKDTYNAFASLIDSMDLADHVALRQVGAMGFDGKEPTVEVVGDDKKRVIYGCVKAADAKSIVESHVVGKKPVASLVIQQ